MIKISQIKLPMKHSSKDLEGAIEKSLKLKKEIKSYKILKKSIDARKKEEIKFIYTVDVDTSLSPKEERALIKRLRNQNIVLSDTVYYQSPKCGTDPLSTRPVVVGTGPAGLFCGLMLARSGYKPLIIERGMDVEERVQVVEHFWKTNELNPKSNVQFGEGGAGTFSDGKLNTLVKDEYGRNKKVLEIFVEHGAPTEITYLNKPHIGTDQLRGVVKSMREEIISLGGEVRFQTQLTNFIIEGNELKAIELNHEEVIPCEAVVLAIGHSARDTFEMLYKKGLELSKKSFAIGLRVEHSQQLISEAMYGRHHESLPTADYKLTHKASNNRGVYSFCMCPGGFVVNSSSEEGRLVVNGMSNYNRDERNANSAIIVTVTPEDFDQDTELTSEFGSDYPLIGMEFQRKWERKAYEVGKGYVPVQLFGDLLSNKISDKIGSIEPNIKGKYQFGNLRECLPTYVIETIIEGMQAFDKKIAGFGADDVVLSGVETRTSSPIRIHRDEAFECNVKGIYPCGEGAGYAGGITSAAIDGIKVYEALVKKYQPL